MVPISPTSFHLPAFSGPKPQLFTTLLCALLLVAGASAQSGSGGGSGSGGSGGGDDDDGGGSGSGGEIADIPTGGRPSPLFGAEPFTQQILLFEEFGTESMPGVFRPGQPLPRPASLDACPDGPALDTFLRQRLFPAPTRESNQTLLNPYSALVEAMLGRPLDSAPAEGRPPGEGWAHQRWSEFAPRVYFQSAQTGARRNNGLRDSRQRHRYSVGEFAPGGLYHDTAGLGSTAGTTRGIDVKFHPNMPTQDPLALWTFDGTFPPKLLLARYGQSVLFRHYNALPIDPSANLGFGAHTISTHEHNGHNPAESDGYASAFFFPGQYYDYVWPMILAGHDTVNTGAADARAGSPNGAGGIRRLRGDYRETMSTHWFHDHMLDFTAQNVYKGNAAMMNYYSSIDRGNEALEDGVNLRLPSGTALDWGNRDYDVNLVIGDKAWDSSGQLWFNIFNTDGFLGDRLLTNWTFHPAMEVRARKYRFRLLNGCVSRYLKLALVDQNGVPVPFHMIANDGNIMEHAVAFDGTLGTQRGVLPEQGIAERYDIVVDFSRFQPGDRVYFVNTLAHRDGRAPEGPVSLSDILTGVYAPRAVDVTGDGQPDQWIGGDPCVGKFMEFRVREYSGRDLSMNPADYVAGRRKMLPLARPTEAELAQATHRTFEFGRSSGSDDKPWTIKTDGGEGLGSNPALIAAAPNLGALTAEGLGHLEIWKLETGGGWDHPVHVHFEEGILLKRDEQDPPEWEKWARKDVYRIGSQAESGRSVEFAIRFREFAGTYMEHCHNTQHEDTAMLLRWDVERPGQFTLLPAPMPSWDGVDYVASEALPTIHSGDGTGPSFGSGGGGGGGPGPETLAVTSLQYSPTRGWRLTGTSTGATVTPLRVRARVGTTLTGTIVGSAAVGVDGAWSIRVSPGPTPDASNRVSLESTGGATLLGLPLTIVP